MIRRIGKYVVVAALVVLVFCLVVPGFASHVSAWRQQAGKAVDRASSDEHLIIRAQEALKASYNELKEFYVKKAEMENAVAGLQKQRADISAQLSSDERNLKIAAGLLQSQQGDIKVGDKTYSRSEIVRDINTKRQRCEANKAGSAKIERTLNDQLSALNQLSSAIEQAKTAIKAKVDEINIAKTRLAQLRAEKMTYEAIVAMQNRLVSLPLGPETDVGLALRAVEERISKLDVDVQFLREQASSTSGSTDVVPSYDPAADEATVLSGVSAYFSSSSPAEQR